MAAQAPTSGSSYVNQDITPHLSGGGGGGLASWGANIASWLANLAPQIQGYAEGNATTSPYYNSNSQVNKMLAASGADRPTGGGIAAGASQGLGLGAAAGPYGALIGALAGGVVGGIQKKDADKDAREQEKKRNAIIQTLMEQQAAQGSKSQLALKDGIAALQKGTAGALNEVTRTGRGAKTRVLDREKQNLGAITQGLTSRGLGSTTRSASLSRGVRSDSDRALLDIDDALTRIRSGIIQRGSQGEAQMQGQLANLFQRQAGQSATQAQGFTNAIQPDVQSFDAGSLGALGPLLSVLLGGQEGSASYQNLFASPNAAQTSTRR